MDLSVLPPWEAMLKRMVWHQLGEISGKKILDFGSGKGETACFYARCNDVLAIEPSQEAVDSRWQEYGYSQLTGSTEQLRKLTDESFDVILCHNVLEYAEDRESIVREFARLLKKDGLLSVVKHNRAGRVMQMAVLLNDFNHANALLNGENGSALKYGMIRYFEDEDIENWCAELKIEQMLGMRTFWDLQQKQDCHTEPEWQKRMLALENRVAGIAEYAAVAFFHHLFIRKQ